MLQTTLSIFDLIVLGIVGLSAILSFFRGFLREIISLGAWAGALVITLYFWDDAKDWMMPQVKNEAIAGAIASISVFFVSLISISLLMRLLLKFTKTGSEVGLLDNLLGLMFGTARGILVVAIGYFIFTFVVNESDYPDWVANAKTRPHVERATNWVMSIAPSYLNALREDAKETIDEAGDEARDVPVVRESKKLKKKAVEAVEDIDTPDEPDFPTIEELQRRIRAENEDN